MPEFVFAAFIQRGKIRLRLFLERSDLFLGRIRLCEQPDEDRVLRNVQRRERAVSLQIIEEIARVHAVRIPVGKRLLHDPRISGFQLLVRKCVIRLVVLQNMVIEDARFHAANEHLRIPFLGQTVCPEERFAGFISSAVRRQLLGQLLLRIVLRLL